MAVSVADTGALYAGAFGYFPLTDRAIVCALMSKSSASSVQFIANEQNHLRVRIGRDFALGVGIHDPEPHRVDIGCHQIDGLKPNP
jgi:hypothetical protein